MASLFPLLIAVLAQSAPLAPAPSAIFISVDPRLDSVRLTSPAAGVAFDIDGDGDLEQVSWTEPGAAVALLAIDRDGDGRITTGAELFGSFSVLRAANGPNALIETFKATGAPLSGAVQHGHTLYEQLLLWVDGNHNGISEKSELRPVKEVFTAIGLGFVKRHRLDQHGNIFRYRGWAELRTEGPEQGRAKDFTEERLRRREYFEVVLQTGERTALRASAGPPCFSEAGKVCTTASATSERPRGLASTRRWR